MIQTHMQPHWSKGSYKHSKKNFPQIPITEVDERYTSRMASQAIHQMGLKKKDRQAKGLVDEVAATIMLQEFMQRGNI